MTSPSPSRSLTNPQVAEELATGTAQITARVCRGDLPVVKLIAELDDAHQGVRQFVGDEHHPDAARGDVRLHLLPVLPELLAAVPVSPLETTSLERVARAVAVAVGTPALEAFPANVTNTDGQLPRRVITSLIEAGIPDPLLSPLFHRAGDDVLALRRPLTASEDARLTTWARDRLSHARGSGWERDHEETLQGIPARLAVAADEAAQLLTCPSCGLRLQPGAMDRDRGGDLLLVTCPCGAHWGHHRCAQCQSRIPFVAPTRHHPTRKSFGPGWVERTYGQHALSSPCWRADNAAANYVCPRCGDCGGWDRRSPADCARCALRPDRR